MMSMWNAGLRIVDLRDPRHPTEVGYFNPGAFGGRLDKAWAHVRYRPESGQIWLATESGGFWVLELEPQVRAALGLPARPSMAATLKGRARPEPATPVRAGTVDVTAYYCTLARARA
jgi:hypothetical protein